MFDHEWTRVRKADAIFFAGDTRYEGTDEHLDGLLMLRATASRRATYRLTRRR